MIEIRNIQRVYRMGDTDVHAVRDISLTIDRGEFVAIMGPSGSGKSTLMHILGLLDRPNAGSYRLLGREVSGLNEDELAAFRSRNVGFVFQQFHLLPRTTARENAALPLLYSAGELQFERVDELMRGIGMGSRLMHKPNEMSGGQQQRVAIVRALVNDPEVILADEPTGNLDSASAGEIMAVLADLNRRGKTIILVTHETDIARYANRVITLRDGKLLSDERRTGERPAAAPVARDEDRLRLRHRGNWRRFPNLVRQAFRNLTGNKVRSGLSMLGILIGVAAVIAMLALGNGARQAIRQQLAALGSNALMLMPGAPRMQGVVGQAGSVSRITVEDIDALKKSIPSILRIAPMVNSRVQAIGGGNNWNTQVVGTGPDYAAMRSSVPQVGRFITADDVNSRAKVAVIGMTPLRSLFGEANPIGQFVRLNRVSFQIVGILPEKGSDRWRDQDDVVIVPLSTAMYRLLGREFVDSVNIEIVSEDKVQPAQEEIVNLMRKRHRIPDSNEEPYHIHNLAEIQATVTQTSRTLSMLLASIAVISLVVGGIGIMNIMLVSVTERTREIGLRKAVGARSRDIQVQFLTEAVTISLFGGLSGILLGWAVAFGISTFAGWAAIVSPQSVAVAFLFSALIGVIFGFWPARKAAQLDPIEALRYE